MGISERPDKPRIQEDRTLFAATSFVLNCICDFDELIAETEPFKKKIKVAFDGAWTRIEVACFRLWFMESL